MAEDWMSALSRLTDRGLPQDTELHAGGPFSGPFSRTERAEQGGVEALPLGDPADPISQIAMILAPLLSQYRGMQAPVSQALQAPMRRTLPTPTLPDTLGSRTEAAVARMRSLQEGGLPGTRLTTPRPREQLYRADAPVEESLSQRQHLRELLTPDMPANMPDTSTTGMLHSGIRERLAHLRSQGIDTSGFERIYGDIQHAAATMENYAEFQELTELHRELSRAMANAYRASPDPRR